MNSFRRHGRIRTRFVVILGLSVVVIGAGLFAAYRYRSSSMAANSRKEALAALEAGRWEDAVKHLNDYLNRRPEDTELLMRYADANLRLTPPGNAAAAKALRLRLRLYTDAELSQPKVKDEHGELCELLCRLYYQGKQYSDALYIAEQRLKLDNAESRLISNDPRRLGGHDINAAIWKARALIQLNKEEQAEKLVEALTVTESDGKDVTSYPAEVRAWALRADLRMRDQANPDRDGAGKILDACIEANPESPAAYALRAQFNLNRMGTGMTPDQEMALRASIREDAHKADDLNPKDANVLLMLGNLYLRLRGTAAEKADDYARARATLDRLHKLEAPENMYDLDPRDLLLAEYQFRAGLMAKDGSAEERIKLAEEGLEKLPNPYRMQFVVQAVDLCLMAGDQAKAEAVWSEHGPDLKKLAQDSADLRDQVDLVEGVLLRADGTPYEAAAKLEGLVARNDALPQAWRQLARAYIDTRQNARAIRALERYLGLGVDDEDARAEIARLSYQRNEFARAYAMARQIENSAPDNLENKLVRMEAELRGGNGPLGPDAQARLAGELTALREAYPDRVEPRLLLARLEASRALSAGDDPAVVRQAQQKAITELEAAMQSTNPEDVRRATLILADFHAQLKELDKAIELCRQAVEQSPESAEPVVALANLLAADGRSAEGIKLLAEDAMQKFTGEEKSRVVRGLSALHFSQGQRKDAIGLLKQEAEDNPDDVQVRLALLEQPEVRGIPLKQQDGRTVTDLGGAEIEKWGVADVDEAERLIGQIKTIETAGGIRWAIEQAKLWNERVELLERLRQVNWADLSDERRAALEKSGKIDGEASWTKLKDDKRDALTNEATRKAVEAELVRCTAANPDSVEAVMYLGNIYQADGREDQAIKLFTRFVDTHPGNVPVANALLTLLQRMGQVSDAMRVLNRLPGGMNELSMQRVSVELQLGDRQAAESTLRAAIAANPEDGQSRALLAGLVYKGPETLDAALKLLDEAEALQPGLLVTTRTRVRILDDADRKEEALQVLDQLVSAQGNFIAYLLRAEYLIALGRNEDAQKDVDQLTKVPGVTGGEAYQAQASFAVRMGDANKALELCKAGLVAHPNFDPLRRLKVTLQCTSSDDKIRAEGMAGLSELIAEQPDDMELKAFKGTLLLRSTKVEDRDAAVALLEEVVRRMPRNVAAHWNLIHYYSQRGEYERARTQANLAVGANPDSPDLQLVQAEVSRELGDLSVSRNLAQRVLDSTKNNVPARLVLAKLNLVEGRYDDARRLTAEALELDPTSSDAQLLQAELLNMDKKYKEAVEQLEAFRKTRPAEDLKILLALADLNRLMADYARADELLAIADTVSPWHPDIALVRLRVLTAQQKYDDMMTLLKTRRLTIRDECHVLTGGAAMLINARAQAQVREMRALFDGFTSENPARLDGHLGRGMVYYASGRDGYAEAEKSYRRVLDIERYNQKALNNLAWLVGVDLDRPDEAVKYAQDGVNIYPKDPHLLNTLGVLQYKLGQFDNALKSLEQCLLLTENIPSTRAKTLVYIGRAHGKLGRQDKARSAFSEAADIDRKLHVLSDEERGEIGMMLNSPAGARAIDPARSIGPPAVKSAA